MTRFWSVPGATWGPTVRPAPICNGAGCKNTIPGPGSKDWGPYFPTIMQHGRRLPLNLDTICSMEPVNTGFSLFAHSFFFATLCSTHWRCGKSLRKQADRSRIRCRSDPGLPGSRNCRFPGRRFGRFPTRDRRQAMEAHGFAIPTIKPWSRDLVFRKIDQAKEHGAQVLCMDIDASGLPFLKNMDPLPAPRAWKSCGKSSNMPESPSS